MSRFLKILIAVFLILVLIGGFSLSHIVEAKESEEVIYICPNATSLEEVNPSCEGRIDLRLGETINGMTLTITNYEGKDYYTILGFENGGAGVLAQEVRLETQIAITQMEYGEIDILATTTQQVGDGKSPLLLSELKSAKIDLEKYLPENKRKIYPSKSKKLKMKFKFLETAGNEYQGKSINVKFKFLAIQEK